MSTVTGSERDGAAVEDASDLEDGEVAEDDLDQQAEARVESGHFVSNGQPAAQATQSNAPVQPPLPQALLGSGKSPLISSDCSGSLMLICFLVSDEAMRNLMMSWYYAGYYTGLVEGQRTATKPDSG